jgi:pimeloyl-ACP methyl ester carboxylesterase
MSLPSTNSAIQPAAVTTTHFPLWFGPNECPLRGWIHEPHRNEDTNEPSNEPSNGPLNETTDRVGLRRANQAVIVVPGFGYEEFVLAFGLRSLAEQLANRGIRVLRYDHPGTGDSADPDDVDGNDLDRWIDGVHEACRTANADHLTLLGVRLGASIATLAASKLAASTFPVDSLVLWEPVVSGRRLVRELTLLTATSNANRTQPDNDSVDERTLVVGGFVVPISLREPIRSLDLKKITEKPSEEALIIGSPQRPTDASFTAHLSSLGSVVTSIEITGSDEWLERSSELAIPPSGGFEKVIAHIIAQPAKPTNSNSATKIAAPQENLSPSRILVGHAGIRETAIQLGVPKLAAVLVQPMGTSPAGRSLAEKATHQDIANVAEKTAVLLCNSGVERSTGPGRAWVPLARQWASEGRTVLRLDLSGVGNSECWPGQLPFQTYGYENPRDISLGIDQLKTLGHERIVVVGLCASAFSALQGAPVPGIVGVVSVNVQFYRAGTEAGNETITSVVPTTNYRRYRMAKIDERVGIRRKVAWLAELAGRGHASTQWMQRWTASGATLLLLFGGDDRGLRYLLWRAPLGLQRLRRSQRFTLEVLADLDHALHAPGPRARAVQRIAEFVATFDQPSPT